MKRTKTEFFCDVCKKEIKGTPKDRKHIFGYAITDPFGVRTDFATFGFYGNETHICDECLDDAIIAQAKEINLERARCNKVLTNERVE